MKARDIAELVDAEAVFRSALWDEREIETACSSDLMSDILTLDVSNAVLVTGLTNEQVIRTAEMADIHTILLVRSKVPTEGMLKLARECDISLMCTRLTMFTVCGRLMNAGLQPPY